MRPGPWRQWQAPWPRVRRAHWGGADLGRRVIAGDRAALSRAITLVESKRRDHGREAEALLDLAMKEARRNDCVRVGVSGSPGVGKSTFIENLGYSLVERGIKVAVLAVDPSSPLSGGSLLGDKSRMERLTRSELAYVRPSPTRGFLGGLAQSTDEAATLCQAAGFGAIIVETVGVGQSEAGIADVVDVVVLMVAPGAGDDLQAAKRGNLEFADFLVINKADGDYLPKAVKTSLDYESMLPLSRRRYSFWPVPVLLCSAEPAAGDAPPPPRRIYRPGELWADIERLYRLLRARGELARSRVRQRQQWTENQAVEHLRGMLHTDSARAQVDELVAAGKISTRAAARRLVMSLLSRGLEE